MKNESEAPEQNAIMKAEAYLQARIATQIGYPSQEALVYMVSRGINCDDAIQELRKIWRVDSVESPCENQWRFWCKYDPYVVFYDSTMLRVAEWCEIGGFDEYWTKIYRHTEIHKIDDTLIDFYPVFPYFRSDLAISNMKKQLDLSLVEYEKFFQKALFLLEDSCIEDGGWYFVGTLVAATFLFGTFRIENSYVGHDVMENVANFLLRSQEQVGAWWDNRPNMRTGGVYQAAMAIHALCTAKPEGYNRSVNMAKNWIISQQHGDGYWEDHFVPCRTFLTVLVLDALELANGGQQVTFSLPSNNHTDDRSKPNIDDHREHNSVTINAHGPVVLRQASNEQEDIDLSSFSPDKIKKQIDLSQQGVLKDEINRALYIEFQKYELQKDTNCKVKRPSYRVLAEALYANKVTARKLSAQTIKNRVGKLIKAKVITDYYEERKRRDREQSLDPEHLYDREDRNY